MFFTRRLLEWDVWLWIACALAGVGFACIRLAHSLNLVWLRDVGRILLAPMAFLTFLVLVVLMPALVVIRSRERSGRRTQDWIREHRREPDDP